MFLMLGDNDSHVFFNTWRLPRLLRLCNTKSLAHHSMTNHMQKKKKKKLSHVKEKFSRCNPRVQKFHIKTKNPCKFFFSHNQNPHDQKLLPTKNHAPKKVNAPPKISSQSKCFTYPYTTTKSFFHNHAQKFLHDQDSQQIISYLSMHNK